MIIQDAIKSGKPFKRKDHSDDAWAAVSPSGKISWLNPDSWHHEYWFTKNDILAEDWEIKE